MGLADLIDKETRIEMKVSDIYGLLKADVEADMLKKAVIADVPNEYIQKMITGKNDELEAYRETGLDPDKIREMDRLYTEKCGEVVTLQKEVKEADHKIAELLHDLENRKRESATLKKELEDAYSWIKDDEKPDPKVDEGKIRALHKSGWSIADIAVDIGCSAETVKRVLKKK